MVVINFYSERKGSNPGGKCSISRDKGGPVNVYLKYCNSSYLRDTAFTPSNQPYYEALSLVLAQRMGLEVPRFSVLENRFEGIEFRYSDEVKGKLDPNKVCYFLSKLVELPEEVDEKGLALKLKDEKLYRDLLMIGDVSRKRQNHALIKDSLGQYVLYIDLGCTFVDAVGGVLSQRNEVKKLLKTRSLKKDLKLAKDRLSKCGLITNHRRESDKDLICLDNLIEEVPEMPIPLFPAGYKRAKAVLSSEELDEINSLLTLNMFNVIREYKDSNLLVNC